MGPAPKLWPGTMDPNTTPKPSTWLVTSRYGRLCSTHSISRSAFGRGFGFEVRFLLGSRRLNSVGARLYFRLGKLAPGAQGKPKSYYFQISHKCVPSCRRVSL